MAHRDFWAGGGGIVHRNWQKILGEGRERIEVALDLWLDCNSVYAPPPPRRSGFGVSRETPIVFQVWSVRPRLRNLDPLRSTD